jgi:spore coat polysaccharide biosynthesis predicted glycosyltransferase SpsG
MLEVDFCITAAGQTTLELIVTKTPFLLIKTEFNQSAIYDFLIQKTNFFEHNLLEFKNVDSIIQKFEKSIDKVNLIDFSFPSFTAGNSLIIQELIGVSS